MKALFTAIGAVIREYGTDAKGRPEIKVPLAILAFAAAITDFALTGDFGTSVSLLSTGLVLLGLTTAGDAAIDKKS